MSYRMPNPASLSHDERMQYRAAQLWNACKNAEPEILNDGSALYTADDAGRFYLQIFAGKALRVCRPVSGYYRTDANRDEAVARFKQSREQHQTRQLLRRQEARKPHTLKLGDVLYTSWGYEQTNIDFYEVVAVSGAMVTLRQLAANTTETGFMSGETMPRPGQFIGESLRRRPDASNRVRIASYASASLWDGKPKHATWYA